MILIYQPGVRLVFHAQEQRSPENNCPSCEDTGNSQTLHLIEKTAWQSTSCWQKILRGSIW